MSILGLIILLFLSSAAIFAIVLGNGIKNYAIRNTVGIYTVIIALLAIIKSSIGIFESLYLGIASLITIICAFVFFNRDEKNNYSKVRILYIVAVLLSTLGAYMSYID